MTPTSLPIFGPPRAWKQEEFTASDDRVRGGSSQSFLSPSATLERARFHGTLDTTTLGGAGFASQRTTTDTRVWDLSEYAGVELQLGQGDGKRYTLNVKTVLPHKMDNGRDASTIEYAFSFTADATGDTTRRRRTSSKIFAKWSEFEPFYRGKPVEGAEPLDPAKIRRWSLMMRSFFEQQSGPFSLTLYSIKARHSASDDASSTSSPSSLSPEKDDDADWDDCDVEVPPVSEKRVPVKNGTDALKFCAIL